MPRRKDAKEFYSLPHVRESIHPPHGFASLREAPLCAIIHGGPALSTEKTVSVPGDQRHERVPAA